MTIARTIRPTVIVAGTVQAVQARTKRESAEVYRHDVTMLQDNGAQVSVQVWDRTGVALPALLAPWAVVCSVEESREFGANLSVESLVTEDQLDRIHSGIAALAGSAK